MPLILVFSALRAYASSGGGKMLGCLVLVLSLAPVGVNLVRKSHAMFWKIQNTDHLSRQVHYGFQISGSNYPPFGCLQTGTTTEALNLRYSLSTWSSYSDTENVEDVGSHFLFPGIDIPADTKVISHCT